jgi:alpha-ribazole phosphatase
MRSIVLVRHGAIATTASQSYLGQTDVCLSQVGERQMRRLGQVLADWPISQLISSPLLRCRQSAALLCGAMQIPWTTDTRLAEIDLGQWDGLSRKEIRHRFPAEYAARGRDLAGYRPPDGESFGDLAARTWPVLEELCRQDGDMTLILAHAGVNRVLLCQVLGLPIGNLFRLGQDFACLNLIEVLPSGLSCRLLNWQPQPTIP